MPLAVTQNSEGKWSIKARISWKSGHISIADSKIFNSVSFDWIAVTRVKFNVWYDNPEAIGYVATIINFYSLCLFFFFLHNSQPTFVLHTRDKYITNLLTPPTFTYMNTVEFGCEFGGLVYSNAAIIAAFLQTISPSFWQRRSDKSERCEAAKNPLGNLWLAVSSKVNTVKTVHNCQWHKFVNQSSVKLNCHWILWFKKMCDLLLENNPELF